MTEFGVFDLFRFDSFIVHFSFVRFHPQGAETFRIVAFQGRVGNTAIVFSKHGEGAFPMTGKMDRNNDFDKGRLALELPGEMHEALAKPAGFCWDILASDHPGADFAEGREKAV